MSRKSMLLPYELVAGQSLAASFYSASTIVKLEDALTYQINITTSDSIGSFQVQGSLDGSNWSDLGTAGIVNAANDVSCVDVVSADFFYFRLSYTATTSGTGTCDIWVASKAKGG